MKVKIELVDDDGRLFTGEATLVEGKLRQAPPSTQSTKSRRTLALPERIVALREKGFFTQPKVSSEVYEEIKKTYYCQRDRVTMALIRLQKSQQLRKASKVFDGKKMNAYVW